MGDQDKRLGVYFHIPFCASKCAYCDFCSLPGRDKLMPYYQDALLIQLQETMPRMTDYFIDTVYFGGGTPSYYGARRIVEILQELKVTNRLMKQSEITVRVQLGRGTAEDTVWTCDLSHEYVTINADYRS